MFTAALFTRAKRWTPAECPSAGNGINPRKATETESGLVAARYRGGEGRA